MTYTHRGEAVTRQQDRALLLLIRKRPARTGLLPPSAIRCQQHAQEAWCLRLAAIAAAGQTWQVPAHWSTVPCGKSAARAKMHQVHYCPLPRREPKRARTGNRTAGQARPWHAAVRPAQSATESSMAATACCMQLTCVCLGAKGLRTAGDHRCMDAEQASGVPLAQSMQRTMACPTCSSCAGNMSIIMRWNLEAAIDKPHHMDPGASWRGYGGSSKTGR